MGNMPGPVGSVPKGMRLLVALALVGDGWNCPKITTLKEVVIRITFRLVCARPRTRTGELCGFAPDLPEGAGTAHL
ncbi:hypothetical protein GA0115261_1000827 [Streptomyces sp. OspMP-M43]|nr:hypothetical protein GA0115261_1000827 [Streptomyces sp. OspMP-M43]